MFRLLASRPVRWAFLAAVIGIACYALTSDWNSARSALARLGVIRVAGAMVAVLAAAYASVQLWRYLLAALGSPLPGRVAARILLIGQLGKYLPGSIWPVLAQMELASTYHVPRIRSATTSVLNVVVALLTGSLLAVITLPFAGRSTPYLWLCLLIPVLAAFLHPRPLGWLLNLLLRIIRQPQLDQPINGRALATGVAWSLLSWFFYGLQIWLLITRLGAPFGRAVLLSLGGYALAWCVGFIVVFVPAGAGVRDVLLAALLAPVIGTGGAAAVALVSRALNTLSDVISPGIAVAFNRFFPAQGFPQPARKPQR
jgi:glycosyltransferase 2 family protein